ncbi:MAG: hypothetical protein PHE55_11335 [Methylococcaceae bacterium]|nr:hypothetical protein [Methylococcaceae bacterium]
MTTEKKQADQQFDNVKKISLVDIEELRKTLGAESEILDSTIEMRPSCNGGRGTTCMCPEGWLS